MGTFTELATKEISTGSGAYLVLSRDEANKVAMSVRLSDAPEAGDREVVVSTAQSILARATGLLEQRGYGQEALSEENFPVIASGSQDVVASTALTVPQGKTDGELVKDFGQAASLGTGGLGPRIMGDRDRRERRGGYSGEEHREGPRRRGVSEEGSDATGGRRGNGAPHKPPSRRGRGE